MALAGNRGVIRHDTHTSLQIKKDGLNYSIDTFKKGLEVFARMLASHDVTLVFRGTDCYTDGKKIVVPDVELLSKPNMTDEEITAAQDFLEAMRGHVVHEVGHKLFTDFTAIEEAVKRENGPLVKQTWNALEDAFIERKMTETFRGTVTILDNMNEWHARRLADQFKAAEVAKIAKVVLGVTMVSKFGTDHWFYQQLEPDIQEVLQHLGNEIAATRTIENSWETLTVATDLIDKIRDLIEKRKQPPKPKKQKKGDKPARQATPEEQEKYENGELQEAGEDEKGESIAVRPPPKKEDDFSEDEEDESDGDGDDGDAGEDSDAGGSSEASGERADVGDDPKPRGGRGGGSRDEGEEDDADDADGGGADSDEGDEDDPGSGSDESGDDADSGASGDDGGEDEDDSDRSSGSSGSAGDEDGDEDDSDSTSSGGGALDDEEGDSEGTSTGDEEEEEDEGPKPLDEKTADALEKELEAAGAEKAAEDLKSSDAAAQISQAAKTTYANAMAPVSDRYTIFTTEYDEENVPVIRDYHRMEYKAMVDSLRAHISVGRRQLSNILKARVLSHTAHDLEEGMLDRTRLYRLATRGDKRIYKETVERVDLKGVSVVLMINLSGSMTTGTSSGKTRMGMAQEAAYIFGECLSAINVPFEVIGHSTTMFEGGITWNQCPPSERQYYTRWGGTVFDVYKSFSEEWKPVAPRLMTIHQRANTHDAEAVKFAADRLLSRPDDKRRVVIMLDDGEPYPNIMNNNGSPEVDFIEKFRWLQRHADALKDMVTKVERHKVEVIGIGMGSESVQHFYKDHLVIKDREDFSKMFIGKLKSLLLPKTRV